MAIDNKNIVAIPAAVLASVTDLLSQAEAALQPYIIPLTNDERRALPKMSDKTIAFVGKTVDYSVSNPEFIPAYLDAKDLSIDYGNATALSPVLQQALQLYNNLNDTEMEAGSEAYINSLMYYNNVKQGDKNGVSNARAIYEDLKKRFPGRPKKNGGGTPPTA